MASRSRGWADLGVVPGLFGENRGFQQLGEVNLDVSVRGLTYIDDEPHVRIEIDVMRVGNSDYDLELHLPLYKAEQLRDSLEQIFTDL